MEEKNKKRQIAKISVFITSIFVIFMSVTYAFINQTLTGTKEVVVSAGVLDLVLEEGNEITISDALPMYDQVGMIQEPFTFRLVNNGNNSVNYQIKLVPKVTKVETNQKCGNLGEITLDSPENCRKVEYPAELRNSALSICGEWWGSEITEDECLKYEEENGYTYDDFEGFIDLLISYGDLEDTRTIAETYPDNMVEVDLEMLNYEDLRYGLTKNGVDTIESLDSLLWQEKNPGVIDSGTIPGNETINYDLRLWISEYVEDITWIEGLSLSYKLEVEVSQEIEWPTGSVSDIVFEQSLVGENCKTYNDGTDTFLVGECSQNYVWYSGKLWRVVLKNNETGTVKMITDNAITAIPYNESDITTFENSYVEQWLNQEFLPTMHNYEDYLVENSIWNVDIDDGGTPNRPSDTTSVTRTVGLLNSYEYYMTTVYGILDNLARVVPPSIVPGYLKNGSEWWLLTSYDESTMITIDYNGNRNSSLTTSGYGVRPVVNLKSTVQILGGTGAQSNPYILEGDLQEPINGTTLLNTAYSGEYIMFNNELYRIVGIENSLTKITAVNKPNELSRNKFHSELGVTNFASAHIKTDLESYYQNLKLTNISTYNMIEPSTTWYLGTVGEGANYKASVCLSVDTTKSMNFCTDKTISTTANIGLPRVGEMFTSKIAREVKESFWTLTPYEEFYGQYIYGLGGLNPTDLLDNIGARPSMYLKSNVVIASDNTGNGTYEHPYKIELGA